MKIISENNYNNLLQYYLQGCNDNKSLQRLMYLLMTRNHAPYTKNPSLEQVTKAYKEIVEDKNLQELVDKSENWDVKKDGSYDKLNKEFNDVITEKNAEESDYQEFIGPNDTKTCKECKEMLHKIICISGKDKRFMSYDEFLKKHPLHFGCRHSLLPVSKERLKTIQAMNTENYHDVNLYTGFYSEENEYDNIPEDMQGTLCKQDYNFDLETLVLLTPIGNFYGWNNNEKKSVEEVIDDTALTNLVNNFNEEILVDKDHSSCRPPDTRDSSAMGWITELKYIKDLGNMNGLYAKIRWTKEGIKLVRDKIYRYLSPVWSLDSDNKPYKLISVALTNRPAIKTGIPIINTKPLEENEMTKEEIIQLVKDTIIAIEKEKENINKKEEVKETEDAVKEAEPVQNEEVKEIEKEKETSKQEEKIPEEKTTEEKLEEKKEVIKEEILNSESKPEIIDWKTQAINLHGEDFWNFLKKNK